MVPLKPRKLTKLIGVLRGTPVCICITLSVVIPTVETMVPDYQSDEL